jgi:hypothetical protein
VASLSTPNGLPGDGFPRATGTGIICPQLFTLTPAGVSPATASNTNAAGLPLPPAELEHVPTSRILLIRESYEELLLQHVHQSSLACSGEELATEAVRYSHDGAHRRRDHHHPLSAVALVSLVFRQIRKE